MFSLQCPVILLQAQVLLFVLFSNSNMRDDRPGLMAKVLKFRGPGSCSLAFDWIKAMHFVQPWNTYTCCSRTAVGRLRAIVVNRLELYCESDESAVSCACDAESFALACFLRCSSGRSTVVHLHSRACFRQDNCRLSGSSRVALARWDNIPPCTCTAPVRDSLPHYWQGLSFSYFLWLARR